MRKIVSFANNTVEPSYESSVFSNISDAEYINTVAKTDEEVISAAKDAEVILFTSTSLNRNVLSKLENCKLIVRYGIGYDTVDCDAAREMGIIVCNSPKYGVIDVAEHAIALMFAASKNLVAMNDRIRNDEWNSGDYQNVRLTGKTIGFLGFGSIGRAVCKRTNGCEMKPLVYDPYVSDEVLNEYGAKRCSIDEVLQFSDVITCHLPLNDETYHMLGKEEFKKMKNSAILVNTSRGGVINESELIDALENGEIAGVGLDVLEDECGGMDKRMLKVKNAVLSPHVAWNTPDAMDTIHMEVADNVARYFRGERPESIVNGL